MTVALDTVLDSELRIEDLEPKTDLEADDFIAEDFELFGREFVHFNAGCGCCA
jgi:hypothetical protein